MVDTPQAIIHMIGNGGTRTNRRLAVQCGYLSQEKLVENDPSHNLVPLERSERYGGIAITPDQFDGFSRDWFERSGAIPDQNGILETARDSTTHIVVPLPIGTNAQIAREIGREWAEELFGQGHYDGHEYDYLTAFHTDRPHPHSHVLIKRDPYPDDPNSRNLPPSLKIAHRNEDINFETMRQKLVEVAARKGLYLDASSRESRGLPPLNLSNVQYQVRLRDGVVMRWGDFADTRDVLGPSIGPSGRNDSADPSGGDGVAGPSGTNAPRTDRIGGDASASQAGGSRQAGDAERERTVHDEEHRESGDDDSAVFGDRSSNNRRDGAAPTPGQGSAGGPQAQEGDGEVARRSREGTIDPERQRLFEEAAGRSRRRNRTEREDDERARKQPQRDAGNHAGASSESAEGSEDRRRPAKRKPSRGEQVRAKIQKMKALRDTAERRRVKKNLARQLREEKRIEAEGKLGHVDRQRGQELRASLRNTPARRERDATQINNQNGRGVRGPVRER